MAEAEHERLAVKFGKKDEYSDHEWDAIIEEESLAGLSRADISGPQTQLGKAFEI